jgi:hypothetical protein
VGVSVHRSDSGMVRPGGKTRSLSFPSQSLSSSSSFRRFLVLFSGGETMSGDGRGSGVWVCDDAVGVVRIVGSTRAGQSGTAVAACHAFDGGDGGGGAYQLLQWSQLAMVGDRSR